MRRTGSTNITKDFDDLITDINADRVSRNIRRVFFDYLKFQQGMLCVDFDEVLCDIESAINFFEKISDRKMGNYIP